MEVMQPVVSKHGIDVTIYSTATLAVLICDACDIHSLAQTWRQIDSGFDSSAHSLDP
jgi:hypothetical protein